MIGVRTDVSVGESVETLAATVMAEFGAVHVLHNNAGVGVGGYLWTHTQRDWEWVLGVNLWGVIHGVRVFVPLMISQGEPAHIVNTASMAGLISVPGLGAYNVSKHGVVTLSETLERDLRIAGAPIGVSVLCPGLVMTNIFESHRNRPGDISDEGQDPGLLGLTAAADGPARADAARVLRHHAHAGAGRNSRARGRRRRSLLHPHPPRTGPVPRPLSRRRHHRGPTSFTAPEPTVTHSTFRPCNPTSDHMAAS